MRIAINAVAFYIAWFACALGGANGWPWAGAAVAAGAVLLHLALAQDWRPELQLASAAAIMGIVGEGALMVLGAVRYASAAPFEGVPPVWLIGMWFGFATLLNVSFVWLKGRLLLAAALGFVLGPLSYIGGQALGAITINEPYWPSVAAIAVLWGAALPLLVVLGQRWNGVTGYTTPQSSP